MDREPDVKRPRLLDPPPAFHSPHAPPHYHHPVSQPHYPSHSSGPASASHYSEPHHSAVAAYQPPRSPTPSASTASHLYLPTLPPRAQKFHQVQHSGPGPPYLEPQADPRGHPQHQHSATPVFNDLRAGYGPLNPQPPRVYPQDPVASHPPSASSQAAYSESSLGASSGTPAPESRGTVPLHASNPPPVFPAAQMEGHVNVNGVPVHGHHPNSVSPYSVHPTEQYAVVSGTPGGPPASYPQTPISSGYPPVYHVGPTNFPMTSSRGNRKMVRAQQACNNCRARKQKCDEQRPCGYCKTENAHCEYREVPPPKADKNMTMLMDAVASLNRRFDAMESSNAEAHQAYADTQQAFFQQFSTIVSRFTGLTTSTQTVAHGPHLNAMIPKNPGEKVHLMTTLTRGEDGESKVDGRENGVPLGVDTKVLAVTGEAPGSHSTGAHHLMRWPRIRTFYEKVNITSESYVREAEEKQGVLRLYGKGSSGDGTSRPNYITAPSPARSSYSEAPSSHPSPSDDDFYGSSYQNTLVHNIGGLNPDGSLRLDEPSVKRLHDSYMRHMWVIHPIFHATALRTLMDRFMAAYSPDSYQSNQSNSPYAHPAGPNYRGASDPYRGAPNKRKYGSESGPGHQDHGYALPPKRPIDHSISNAIALLVLALGKLCEHEEFIMQDEPPFHIQQQYYAPHHGSPSNLTKASPTQSTTTHGNASSPGYDPVRSGIASPSTEFAIPDKPANAFIDRMNVDRIPGLAYYTHATSILGELLGGRDLAFAHAYMLAGLYMGQLGKVLPSASWIHLAATVVCELRSKFAEKMLGPALPLEVEAVPPNFQPPHIDDFTDLLRIAFWSVLQLEGDIHAELDHLPNSGLASTVDGKDGTTVQMPSNLVGVPNGSTLNLHYGKPLPVGTVMFHFYAQLFIRRILNRAHTALYGVDMESEDKLDTSGKVPGKSWKDSTPIQLWDALQGWRSGLPSPLLWDDKQPPASDILMARLRAKYYGAAYIINRKLLYSALYEHRLEPTSEKALNRKALTQIPNENIKDFLDPTQACSRCVEAALQSTVALDGLLGPPYMSRRPRLTNLHGTAAAQFSNMLVIADVYLDQRLYQLVPAQQFALAMQRTIDLLKRLSGFSPVFKINHDVLLAAQYEVNEEMKRRDVHVQWRSSPRMRVGSLSAGPGTPRHLPDTGSGASSFSAR